MSKSKYKNVVKGLAVIVYFVFITISFGMNYTPGEQIGSNFTSFFLDMLKILPCAFILIGLFEVWVKTETIEKHFGCESGIKGYLLGILLAGTTVGGLYVAFPVAYSLYNKGAKLGIILTYISASGIARIPMTVFEASFLGLKFTLVRFLVSVPLVILTSVALGSFLSKRDYKMAEGK